MKARKILLWLFGAATVAVLALIGVTCATVVALGTPHRLDQQIENQQRALLYHTDHAAVLSECRQYMRELKLPKEGMSFDGSDSRLPTVIRQLRPTRLTVSNDHMFIGFGGGFVDGHRFSAFAQGSDLEKHETGIRLLPGIWYSGGQNGTPSR